MAEVAHSELSPSKRHRWGACPGSIREEAKYPEPPGGAAANDGTRTHTLLESLINQGVVRAPQEWVGQEVTDQYGTYTIDQDRVDRLNVAIDYIRSVMVGQACAGKPVAEKRVFPDGLVGRGDLHGTVDCQIPGKEIYHIIDYKDGMSPVDAVENPQLELYALGVAAGLEKQPKSYQLTVIQPKLAKRKMNPISTWNISTTGLMQKAHIIRVQADATDDPNAPLVPGEEQCKYCRAKGSCPALAQKAMDGVSMMFNPIPTTTIEDVATQAANKDPNTMSVEELAKIQASAPLMRQLLKAVDERITELLVAGTEVPGYKLVNGPGKRTWNLPEEQMEKKLTNFGIPKSALYPKTFPSVAFIEKLAWDKGGTLNKLSAEQVAKLNKEYVTHKTGALTVAPESDPRPAVVMNAAPLFAAIDVVATPVEVIPDWLAIPDWLK